MVSCLKPNTDGIVPFLEDSSSDNESSDSEEHFTVVGKCFDNYRDYRQIITGNCTALEISNSRTTAPRSVSVRERWDLISWIIEAAFSMELSDEAVFLAVTVFDRVSELDCSSALQAATALWMAAKMEEVESPVLLDFVYLCDSVYSTQDLIDCEISMTSSLAECFSVPTPKFFLDLEFCRGSNQESELARLLLFGVLFHWEYSRVSPALLARTAKILAHSVISGVTSSSEGLTDWRVMIPCAELIAESLHDISKDHYNALHSKFQKWCGKTSHDLHKIIVRSIQRLAER
jgi:hypothetical protein